VPARRGGREAKIRSWSATRPSIRDVSQYRTKSHLYGQNPSFLARAHNVQEVGCGIIADG
jgi:hypothetical protein